MKLISRKLQKFCDAVSLYHRCNNLVPRRKGTQFVSKFGYIKHKNVSKFGYIKHKNVSKFGYIRQKIVSDFGFVDNINDNQ